MDAAQIFLFLLALTSTMGLFIVVQRFFSPPKKEEGGSLSDLVKEKAAKSASVFDRLNPDGTMLEKLDLFLAKTVGVQRKLEEMHMLLGSPDKPNPLHMLHMKELVGVGLPVFLVLLTGTPLMAVTAVIGFMLPDVIFSGKIQRRQENIIGNFPTMVDLAALIIESGLDYMTAFERIIKTTPHRGELELEMEKMLNEVQLGYARRDALRNLAARTGLQEVRSFVGLIIQSDELGTSLVELLRNYAADMRFRRLNRAERLAAQASTKMLIPLFIFIFPTVFILMLSPMVMGLLKGGLPF
ncbi:MAG: type II secretion system F family protein [Elusimicrobiales bacterium]|nr:type II secretion system F family protein [Elusimicrobiales bacterium]